MEGRDPVALVQRTRNPSPQSLGKADTRGRTHGLPKQAYIMPFVLNPNPGRSIPLATHLGHEISNSIDLDPSPGMIAFTRRGYSALLTSPTVRQVGQPTGRYNCHGLVFGSRRTNIPEAGSPTEGLVDFLLTEDQYSQVPEAEAREGDIVVWRNGTDVDHTGFVSHVQRDPFRAVFVASMWGGFGEFVHPVGQTPYPDCIIEFWRLR
jgi:hypothetical protein